MPGLWSGSVALGMASIPVKLGISLRRRNLGLPPLHEVRLRTISQKCYSSSCEEDVERTELVKSCAYGEDRYAVLEPADFEATEGGASRHIKVVALVERADLQPAQQNRTSYLVAEEGNGKSYLLLLQAMQKKDRVALASFVKRGKEYFAGLLPAQGCLMLHILFPQGEFKHISDVVDLPPGDLKKSWIWRKRLSMTSRRISPATFSSTRTGSGCWRSSAPKSRVKGSLPSSREIR